MEHIDVEYNRELTALETILADVKQPGDFFAAGTIEIPMPRVEVSGVGTLSFPIPRAQIEELVRRATRAPYGRGEETIVDTTVRNVWQIAPSAVKISGKSWAANFGIILSRVKAGLGCEGAKVSAELYKLLVYDRGGFFLAHRDTEKTGGMFGTLVLTLPSAHRGGALRIRHAGREVNLETDTADPSEISFAAFYADCEHEVLPVREGDRVCLVYNLVQEPGHRRTLKAPDHGSQIEKAAAILERYFGSPDAPRKIAWLLDHQYSPAGLSFSSLKGADAARVKVLLQAAGEARCTAHLGIVHIGETGGAEEDFLVRSRHDDYWEDEGSGEEDECGDDVSFSAVTVDGAWQYVDEWRDTADLAAEFGRVPLAGGELLPAGALDQEPPDEKRLIEASGNEGATYERSYHRAALVLWPAKRTVDVLLDGGVVSALPYLKRLLAAGGTGREEAISAARQIVESWPIDAGQFGRYPIDVAWPESSERAALIGALVELNAPELFERFILRVLRRAYDGSENSALLRAAGVFGKERAAAAFTALIEALMPDRPGECAQLLLGLTDPSFHPSFRRSAEAAVAGLDAVGGEVSEPDDAREWRLRLGNRRQGQLAPEFLVNLLFGLRRFESPNLCEAAAGKIASRPEVFDPVALVVPAIERVRAESSEASSETDLALQHLWTSAAQFLLGRSEFPPEAPPDWRLDAELSCTCEDCRQLQAFSRDPVAVVHRFRVNKERRRHLHEAIERHRLDMTHVTERSGSPHTLVCTKDRRTFKARMKAYGDEIAAMRKLVQLAPRSAGATNLTGRMAAAVRASET